MEEFSVIEDTLFVPMLGRIYCSEHFPRILKDEKALEISKKLPASLKGQDTQTQYTLMASAVRSLNMDRYIHKFMEDNPDGVVVLLGCGLETTWYRCDNGKTVFYEVDLPDVIQYRRQILGETERDICIAGDAFGEEWIKKVRKDHENAPVLVAASGLFYYFEEKKVLDLFRNLKKYGNIQLLFDTVNKSGMKRMSHYMKQVGHEEASMYFYVDQGRDLAEKIGGLLLSEEPYYAHTDKKGLKFMTSLTMKISDKLRMVKMLHLQLNG